MNTMMDHHSSSPQQQGGRLTILQEESRRPHDAFVSFPPSSSKLASSWPIDSDCPLLNRAVALNHHGVTLLSSGSNDEEAAMCKFKQALHCLRSDLSSRAEDSSSSSSHQMLDGHSSPQELAIVTVPLRCPTKETDEPSFFHCTRAFFVSPRCTSSCTPEQAGRSQLTMTTTDADLLSAIIIHNMALALMIRSIRRNCATLQLRSLRLYEMCIGLLDNLHDRKNKDNMGVNPQEQEQVLPHEETQKRIGCLLLSMACSNNIGYISSQRGDFEQANRMMSLLQYLLSLVPGFLSASSCLFEEDELQGFTSNVMFLSQPRAAAAA